MMQKDFCNNIGPEADIAKSRSWSALPLLCGRLAGQFHCFSFGCFGHRKAAHDAIEGLQGSVRSEIRR
jgi:hypothetical protein